MVSGLSKVVNINGSRRGLPAASVFNDKKRRAYNFYALRFIFLHLQIYAFVDSRRFLHSQITMRF